MPQPSTSSEYRDLSIEELAAHPVKLGFEFEFGSPRTHETIGRDIEGIFGRGSVGVAQNGYNAHRHGRYDKWNVTSDSSIDAPSRAPNKVELVSPILTPSNFKQSLESVFKYMDEQGAVTNSSTGMHITVSHPNVSDRLDKFDPLKFGLLIDDIAMVQKFRGDLDNRYAQSLLSKFCKEQRDFYNNNRIRRGDLSIPWSGDPEVLFLLTTKEPQIRRTLLDNDKYRSINLTKTGSNLVEVRSPGGDYRANGAADAVETARRILSALVYACGETGTSEYKRLFLSMFDSRIKPRPRPTLRDSDASLMFSMNGITVTIHFALHRQSRHIDGWDLQHTRAICVNRITLAHDLPQADRSGMNSIFSPSSPGARSFHATVNFRPVCASASLVEETYEATLRGSNGPMVVIDECSANIGELRGVVQATAAEEILSKFRALLRSSEFQDQLKQRITAALIPSIAQLGASRVVSLLFPRRFTDRTDFTGDAAWRSVTASLTNAVANQRRSAERAVEQAVPASQWSDTLRDRLNALRANAATANARFTMQNTTEGTLPVPPHMEASAQMGPGLTARASARSSVFGSTLIGSVLLDLIQDPSEAAPSVVRETAGSIAGNLTEVISVFDQLRDLSRANPQMVTSMLSRLGISSVARSTLRSAVTQYTRVSAGQSELRALTVETRQSVLTLALHVIRSFSTLSSALSQLTNADTLLGRLEVAVNYAQAILESLLALRGQVGLVHSPVRLAAAIRSISSSCGVDESTLLDFFSRNVRTSNVFRPTHVGRIRAELASMTQAAEPQEAAAPF